MKTWGLCPVIGLTILSIHACTITLVIPSRSKKTKPASCDQSEKCCWIPGVKLNRRIVLSFISPPFISQSGIPGRSRVQWFIPHLCAFTLRVAPLSAAALYRFTPLTSPQVRPPPPNYTHRHWHCTTKPLLDHHFSNNDTQSYTNHTLYC